MEPVRMTGSRKELLDSYVRRATAKPVHARMLEATALRNESAALREVFAHGASGGALDMAGLERNVLRRDFSGLDPEWIARLARVRALQKFCAEDSVFALEALRWANRHLPEKPSFMRYRKLEAELLAEVGRFSEAQDLAEHSPYLRDLYYSYISVDLKNPFVRNSADMYAEWFEGFNRPFRALGMRPVALTRSASKPFDRLASQPLHGPEPVGGPLVSVVMTVFKPDRDAVLLSAQSILRQSWKRLELIVVDDASPSEYEAIVDELANLDPRVRLVQLSENGGTYRARNVGLGKALGEYVTGQDADDWSHPDRILTQVNFLERNPHIPGVVTYGIRTDENLQRLWRGQLPHRRCEVSLMVKTDAARSTGGYLPARKAADSEFRERLSAHAGVDVATIDDPLYIIRILQDSLSRSDFRSGWSHPNRRNFWDAYTYWHRWTVPEQLVTSPLDVSPIPLPSKFQVVAPEPKELDVVFAGDWRFDGPEQRQMLDEVELLVRDGWRVGLMQVESALSWSNDNRSFFWESAQRLISSGAVTQLVFDEEATADLLILRDPTTMQFPPVRECAVEFKGCVLVADEGPWCSSTEELNYLPQECAEKVREIFGVSPLWVASTTEVQQVLKGVVPDLCDTPLPDAFLPERWCTDRKHLRNLNPVVGRFGSPFVDDWPQEANAVEAMWPSREDLDVRILGETRVPLRVLGQSRPPEGWTVFQPQDISAETFLKSLDFYVHFGGAELSKVRRQLREAMAAGCIVVVADVETAVAPMEGVAYAKPEDVYEQLSGYLTSPERRRAEVRRIQKAAALLGGNKSYQDWFRSAIETAREKWDRAKV